MRYGHEEQYLMLKRTEAARCQLWPYTSTQTTRPILWPTRASRPNKIRDLTKSLSGISPKGEQPKLLITSALTFSFYQTKFKIKRWPSQNKVFFCTLLKISGQLFAPIKVSTTKPCIIRCQQSETIMGNCTKCWFFLKSCDKMH